MTRYAVMLAVVVALLGGAYVYGRRDGWNLREAEFARATAAAQTELDAAYVTVRAQAAEIEAWRQAQSALAQEAEDAARTDPDAGARRPSAASRLRLQTRWGARAATP